jgi:hypothetical protein
VRDGLRLGPLRPAGSEDLYGVPKATEQKEIIPQAIDAMKAFHLTTIAAGHCTGWRA